MLGRVLVVDDEDMLREGIIAILQELGYEAKGASGGELALDIISHERPDVMILDINMPGMDGNEVCEKLKSDNELKDIPVILMTATDTELLEQKVEAALAEDFIMKPFEFKELVSKIDKYLV